MFLLKTALKNSFVHQWGEEMEASDFHEVTNMLLSFDYNRLELVEQKGWTLIWKAITHKNHVAAYI